MACSETVVAAFTHSLISYVGSPTLVLALGNFVRHVTRAVLLHRAGAAALKHGSEDERREAGLEIVKALTDENEPWYRTLPWWRKSGED